MTQVMSKAKWFIPVIVIVAMLLAVGIVWSQSSSGGTVSNLGDLTKQNPAYDDQVVTPPDAGSLPAVLYSITMDPPTSTVPMLGGTVATIVVTNLIPAAINNGPVGYTVDLTPGSTTFGQEVPVNAMANGDITGDMVITADIYNKIDPLGCLAVYTSGNDPLTTLPLDDGGASKEQAVVKIYKNITVHPGLTVTFQVPIVAGMAAVPGAEFMIKAALYLPGTVTVTSGVTSGKLTPTNIATMVSVPWMPGYFLTSTGGTTPTNVTPTLPATITKAFGP
jgi:hypothetical protein